jgi:glycine/D-amino acid oxidase-like deaminating enzyme/nitrite reductase/ring-hydroxylating ferredoxin subunit
MTQKSYWSVRPKLPKLPRLDKDLHADVAIVGGGIMGVTAAYLLKKAGRTVVLLERDRCGSGDTHRTTAHLTYVTDLRLSKLASRFGRDHAQASWDAGRAALQQIHANVQAENLDCDFTWVPGYLHASWLDAGKETDQLESDAQLAAELGFEAHFLKAVPWVGKPGVRFANQAKFHPLKYLAGLLEVVPGTKIQVFESSEVTEVREDPLAVKANGCTVTCDYLIIATHVPLMGKTGQASAALLQTKLAPYSSYALGAKVPRGTLPEALFWDTSDPYYYLRVDRHAGHDYVIFGGEDHKTGQEKDTEARYHKLERILAKHLINSQVDYRWSGQVIETNDGLPLIGETAERQFVATGFAGNGMTFGTLAAMMACEAALGRSNPWQALFDVGRKKLIGGTWNYLKENLDYPYYLIKDRLTKAEGKTLRSIKNGQGKILKLDGQRLAAYRDPNGKVTTLSPTCTHMGCIVHWNQAEATWDCPCHGSRFRATGEVIAGPAETPLEKMQPQQEKGT